MSRAICGRPTKKGTPCTTPVHSWMVGFGFEYADGCYRHMSAIYKEEANQRNQDQEAAWQAYLDSEPACWSWSPLPDLENWTYPRGEDVNDQLSPEALAFIMNDPEAKASAILRHWQDGRCAICGNRQHLVEDHDHQSGMVRGYLCRGCNTQEGSYRAGDTLFGRYRHRHPTSILKLSIRYLDPFTGEYAEPMPNRAKSRAENPWLKLARTQPTEETR